jgi:hypothetical protein
MVSTTVSLSKHFTSTLVLATHLPFVRYKKETETKESGQNFKKNIDLTAENLLNSRQVALAVPGGGSLPGSG